MVRMSACSKPCGSSPDCGPVCAIRVPYYEFPYCMPKYYSTGPYPCYPGFGPCQAGPCIPDPPCGPCGPTVCGPCGPGTAPCCASLL